MSALARPTAPSRASCEDRGAENAPGCSPRAPDSREVLSATAQDDAGGFRITPAAARLPMSLNSELMLPHLPLHGPRSGGSPRWQREEHETLGNYDDYWLRDGWCRPRKGNGGGLETFSGDSDGFLAIPLVGLPARRRCDEHVARAREPLVNLPDGEANRLPDFRGRKRGAHLHRHLVTANLECDRPDWRRYALTRLALQILHHPPPRSLVVRMVTSYARPQVMSRPAPQYLVVLADENTTS